MCVRERWRRCECGKPSVFVGGGRYTAISDLGVQERERDVKVKGYGCGTGRYERHLSQSIVLSLVRFFAFLLFLIAFGFPLCSCFKAFLQIGGRYFVDKRYLGPMSNMYGNAPPPLSLTLILYYIPVWTGSVVLCNLVFRWQVFSVVWQCEVRERLLNVNNRLCSLPVETSIQYY